MLDNSQVSIQPVEDTGDAWPRCRTLRQVLFLINYPFQRERNVVLVVIQLPKRSHGFSSSFFEFLRTVSGPRRPRQGNDTFLVINTVKLTGER